MLFRSVIGTFEARDHFTRHVDTPVVRLADLTGVAGLAGPALDSTPPLRKIY